MKREAKKYTQKQQIAALAQENQRLFGLVIQLSREVQQVGQMTEVTLNIVKQLENYPDLVEKMQEELKKYDAEQKEEVDPELVDAELATQETSITASKKFITDDDGKGAIVQPGDRLSSPAGPEGGKTHRTVLAG